MRFYLALTILLTLLGCGSNPIVFEEPAVGEYRLSVRAAPNNKYLIVVRGHNSTLSLDNCEISKIDKRSVEIIDPYTTTDIKEISKLASNKGYDVYTSDSDSDLEGLLDNINKVANKDTHLMIAMSGECDNKGFIINLVHTAGGMNLVPPDKKLIAEKIIAHLGLIKGVKAVVVNGCQSGCFADAARKDPDFNGVVVAACSVGYATTECQRTGTSAVYAGFLGLYRDEPTSIKNLATSDISAGSWFENFRHKFADIGAGGLPISYSPVIFSTAEYLF